MVAAGNTFTPPARFWRALTFADLLDAAGIASISVSAMDAAERIALAAAAGVHPPSPETCNLTLTILRRRENVRRQLKPLIQTKEKQPMDRRDAVAALLAAPATIAAVARKLTANPTPAGPLSDMVRQAELRQAIDLQNQFEIFVFGIRQRLEAGASLEPGLLGASAVTHMTLKDLVKCGIGDAVEIDGYGILDIAPADSIKREREQWPKLAHEMWA